jgi:Arc/MetJ-type ribon-helix-helix transcriptional regulator
MSWRLPVTIQITKPEVETLIKQRLQSGEFKDADDVVLYALQFLQAKSATIERDSVTLSNKSLREVFESVRGLADDIDFGRNSSTSRPVNLA